jgi:hypothetical protein
VAAQFVQRPLRVFWLVDSGLFAEELFQSYNRSLFCFQLLVSNGNIERRTEMFGF